MDHVGRTTATYDQIAVAYDERNRNAPPSELQEFRQGFIEATSGPLADLGCGPGHDLAAFRADGRRAVGVDLSVGMLALARQRGLPVVRGDLRRPPLQPGSLGGIWSCAALLHVPRKDVPATLEAWRRLLRPDGRLALMTAIGDEDAWERVDYVDGDLQRWFVRHRREDLLTLVSGAGFTVASYGERTSHRQWALIVATP
jgi:SAM-dependent methyltransferase